MGDPENKINNVGAGLVSAHGITLITLVITIIILLILASVAINLSLGDNGLFTTAKKAKEEYLNAQTSEEEGLNDLYSEMLVATGDDSKITISVEDLNKLIENKVQESQPTGIKTDTYICNTITSTSAYTTTVTSKTGFTRTTDENNKISEYLSYSSTDGYTVLKSGWYFIKMGIELSSNTGAVDSNMYFYINDIEFLRVYSWAVNGGNDWNSDRFSIYLNKGDKIYFGAYSRIEYKI